MSQPPLSDIDAEALANFVEPYICAIKLSLRTTQENRQAINWEPAGSSTVIDHHASSRASMWLRGRSAATLDTHALGARTASVSKASLRKYLTLSMPPSPLSGNRFACFHTAAYVRTDHCSLSNMHRFRASYFMPTDSLALMPGRRSEPSSSKVPPYFFGRSR